MLCEQAASSFNVYSCIYNVVYDYFMLHDTYLSLKIVMSCARISKMFVHQVVIDLLKCAYYIRMSY